MFILIKSREIDATSLLLRSCQYRSISTHWYRTVSVQTMMLTVPGGHLKSDVGCYLQSERHRCFRPIAHKLCPTWARHRQCGPTKNIINNGRGLGFLEKREQQWLGSNLLVLVINCTHHRVIVDSNVLVRVPNSHVKEYLSIFKPVCLSQGRDGEVVDVKPRTVGSQAEPKNEANDA